MSIFNKYAQELNQTAKATFEEYEKAEAAFKEAESRRNRNHGTANGALHADAEAIARYAGIEADYATAKYNYEKAQSTMYDKSTEINAIRGELERALGDAFAANPEHMDSATMELVKSGILSADDFYRLVNRYVSEKNFTMVRVLSAAATERAKAAHEKGDKEAEKAFGAAARRGNRENAEAYLQTFDDLCGLYNRCVKHPWFIKKWDALTSDVIENF